MVEDLEDVLAFYETAERYLVSIRQPESADAHRDYAEKLRSVVESMKEP